MSKFSVLIALVLAAACGDPPPPAPPPLHEFTVEVRAEDDNGDPLPRVPVLLDGEPVGLTDADGKFSGTLREREGTKVKLAVGELDSYKFPGSETTEIEETLRVTKVNDTASGVPVFLRVRAESLRKDYLVWVHAKCDDTIENGCEGFPVTLNGEEVARTGPHGYAHFSFSEVPRSDVEIAIDTPAHDPSDEDSAMFEPRDPSYKLTLDLGAHVYVVEQGFVDPEAAAKAKKRKKSKRRKSQRRTKRNRKKKADKPKSEAIQLW